MSLPRVIPSTGYQRGPEGKQGIPGTNGVPSQTAVGEYLDDGGNGVDAGFDAAGARLTLNPISAFRLAQNVAIVDQSSPVVEAVAPGIVADVVDGHVPGSQMAYAQQVGTSSTTNVAPTVQIIPAFTVTVIGTGRPVEIRAFLPKVYHSVANTGVLLAIGALKTGGVFAYIQITEVYSSKNTSGPAGIISRSGFVLPEGEEWSFSVHFAGLAAGTSYLHMGSTSPGYISVTSR